MIAYEPQTRKISEHVTRQCRPGEPGALVRVGDGLVDAAAGQPPGHSARFGLFEVPAGCLLGLMMSSAQWRMVDIITHVSETSAPVRVVTYTRISKDRTGDAQGVANQQKALDKYAADRRWRIVSRQTDNDISASNG